MNTSALRVVKLGGSLLSLPNVWGCLQEWLQRQAAARTVLIVGGGALVDTLRHYDEVHSLDPEVVHWLALDAMAITAKIAASSLPGATITADWTQVKSLPPATISVLDVCKLMNDDHASPGPPLPRAWEVTSDSIAARVAQVLKAEELVLLKSAVPAGAADCEGLAECGYVDPWFPNVASWLPRVRCVDLRSGGYPERHFAITAIENWRS